jgi:hypothetical protein
MKSISDFYNLLSEPEKDLINKTLSKNIRASKSKLLLEKISNNSFSEKKVIKDLYTKNGDYSSFSHLKRRLKDNIIEIVFQHETSKQNNGSMLADKMKCHKNIMLASLLIEKGFNDEAKIYLKQAEKYITDRQLSIEKFMLHLLLLEVSDEYNENLALTEEIAQDLEALNELGRSKTRFHTLKSQGYNIEDIGEDSYKHLIDTNKLSCYYKLLSELKTYVELFQYKNALSLSEKLFQLIVQSPKHFSQPEITMALLTHMKVLVFNKNLKSAIRISCQIEKSGSLRFDMETEFKILNWMIAFLSKDFNQVKEIHSSLLTNHYKNESDKTLIKYLNLCYLFEKGEFDKIIQELLKDVDLQSTNNPVPHALKTLEIYCYLEMKRNDLAYAKLMAFKQYLKRNNTLNKERYQFIVKVLLKLIKNNNKYGITLDYYESNESDSFTNNIQYIQDLHHYEVINLKSWLRKKSIEVGDMYCETVII